MPSTTVGTSSSNITSQVKSATPRLAGADNFGPLEDNTHGKVSVFLFEVFIPRGTSRKPVQDLVVL